MSKNKLRILSTEEIDILKKNLCWTEKWDTIQVTDGFDPKRVVNTVFSGSIVIGDLNKSIMLEKGTTCDSGIFNARLNNVEIGDNCYIASVNGWITNTIMGDEVIIDNVGEIACLGESTFGNGHEISVYNEGGGRELMITKETSAQIAYLSVMYRHNKKLITALDTMARDVGASMKNTKCFIGNKSVIKNTKKIINVHIAEYAYIDGPSCLENGTIDSSKEAPTTVGDDVIAEDFIIQKGAQVKDGAIISASLIGESTKIGRQFSSENSVFFANSEGFHSEACSVFAGPYSVTHHRSTLLIAGYLSFYNAGSGTNQSNHMYKLGPLHQGILERGCKTGSFSYLLWPSKIGAFTAVIGKHYANFDTSIFPFSYINESDGMSVLTPGMNFFTVGTLRDGEKWPNRDKRSGDKKLDLITFDVLSPYTIQKMIQAVNVLTELYEKADKSDEYVTYRGVKIKRLLLKTCKRYYSMAIHKFFGDVLIERIENMKAKTIKDILTYDKNGEGSETEWFDIGGLICPKAKIDSIIASVTDGTIKSYAELYDSLVQIHESYAAGKWNYMLNAYKEENGSELSKEPNENIQKLLDLWKKSSVKYYNMILNDAEKEFDEGTKLSFGIDGNKDEDFEAVRGNFRSNSFVKKLHQNIDEVNNKYDDAVKLIK
ncbi:DUF4954 family protein [Spirochaetota bacterium]